MNLFRPLVVLIVLWPCAWCVGIEHRVQPVARSPRHRTAPIQLCGWIEPDAATEPEKPNLTDTDGGGLAGTALQACSIDSRRAASVPRIYFSGGVVFLELDQPDNRVLTINQNTLEPVLSTKTLDYDTQAGPSFLLGYRLDECSALEMSYFGVHHWSDGAGVRGVNDLRLPGDLGLALDDFFGANRMTVDYSSTIDSVELNYAQAWGSGFEWLVGLRYFHMLERLDLHSLDSDAESSDYEIGAENNLFGLQWGGRWRGGCGRLAVELYGKSGVYANVAEQRTRLGDFDNSVTLRDFKTDEVEWAFLGEIGVQGELRVGEAMYLTGGYMVIWLENVARASDQLDFSDTTSSGSDLRQHDAAFLHGARLGLELRW